MKTLLLSGAAVLAIAVSAPAYAQLEFEAGGFFKGYGIYVNQEAAGAASSLHNFDIIRHTEAHMNGSKTLDNGMQVGFYAEAEIDGTDATEIEESFVYFSGAWGRLNFGASDGAAYLLQVAAPSADSNVDGIRQYVNPVSYPALTGAAQNFAAVPFTVDYQNNLSGYTDKITYLTPVFSGFQAGISYTPDLESSGNDFEGVSLDNDGFGTVLEASLRYETEIEGVGITVGAGWAQANQETASATIPISFSGGPQATTEDREEWNVGIDLDFAGFGIGAVYTEDNYGTPSVGAESEETYAIGADYTSGPVKIGGSYFKRYNSQAASFIQDFDVDRYTGGVVYTYGPGMSFRGSVSHLEVEQGTFAIEATSVLIGTDIKF